MTSLSRLLFRALDRSAAILSSISYLFPVSWRLTSYGEHVRHGIDIYEPKGRRLSVRSPILVIDPSFCLPPLDSRRGASPTRTLNARGSLGDRWMAHFSSISEWLAFAIL